MWNDKQSLYTIITPEQAKKQNQRETAGGSNSEYMSFKGDPRYPSEYFSPEELDASVVKAFKSKKEEEAFKRKQLEKQVATMMNAYDWKRPLATRGPNQGDTSLQNIAAASIGAPLLLLNPATSTIATGPIAHAIEVAMNPLAAETMLGAFLGTGAQAAGITAGIYNASNTIDKWRNGNFDLYDIPYFALDATSAVPVINTMFGLADDAARMTRNTYNAQKAVKSNTKVGSNASKLTEADVKNAGYINSPGNAEAIPLDKNATIINKQSLGQLSSKNPSKLTPEERAGMSRHDRTNVVKEKDAMIQKLHDIDYSYAPYIENTGVYTLRPAKLTRNGSRDEVMNSLIEKGKDKYVNFYDFIQTLPKGIDPKFMPITSSKGWVQNPYITYFRESSIDPELGELLTDGDLARFLTFYDKQLSEGVAGALKDIPVWNASPNNFNVFDYLAHLGENMGNTGVYSPGNYFTTRLPIDYYAGLGGHNIKPYYITNIKETIPAHMVMGKKGYPKPVDIVDGVIPEHRTGDIVIVGKNTGQNISSVNPLLPEVMRNGELVGSKLDDYYDNNVFEISLPRNTGIKSLYPNMDRFVRNEDGTVSFIPVNWNDPRADFKNGGRLLNKIK